MSVIGGLGFFHFVANAWEDPLGSLESRLKNDLPDRVEDRDFLIVLPEALNFGANFNDKTPSPPRIAARDALVKLAEFSRKYGVVFVTSLLEAVDNKASSPYLNSAYLVDGDLRSPTPWRLLCHKKSHGGHHHYQPCPEDPTNCNNPSHCKGVYFGALICNDAQEDVAMMGRLKECGGRTLLCMPAWMNNQPWANPIDPPGAYYVLANSNPSGCPSFVTDRKGHKVEQVENRDRDCLVVKTWDELDAFSGAELGG